MNWHKLLKQALKDFLRKKKNNNEYTTYIQTFANNYKTELANIERHLKKKDYKFGKWKAKLIPKKDGGKRPLIIPTLIKDKLVLKAISFYLSDTLSNDFEKVGFISYAYQKGKSSRDALIQLKKIHVPQNCLLKIDIKHFFDEIDKDILIKLLNTFSINDYVKELICKSINPPINYSFLNKEEIQNFPKGGIPQGNSISAILSNLYLNEFDRLSISNGWKMIRYADDIVFSVSNKKEALLILSQVEKYLLEKRKLNIHRLNDSSESKTAIYDNPQKCHMKYLGIIFDGKNLFPTQECCYQLIGKVKSILKNEATSKEKNKNIKTAIAQWCGYYAFTDIPKSRIKKMNSSINYLIKKWNLNTKEIDITNTIELSRKRQNNKLIQLFKPTRFGEEYEWLNYYN